LSRNLPAELQPLTIKWVCFQTRAYAANGLI
jgi:hypothetical protein